MTYSIMRYYRDLPGRAEVIETDLTREEAREHCSDPETCSDTCTSQDGIARTKQYGPWFDGFISEDLV
jgi:hypothetical protein